MIQNKSGEGEDFAKADSIYYKIKLDIDDILYVGGIYGFSDKGNLTKFQKKSKYSTWSKTWKTRYSFTLCDKNRKVIDPISKHAPGKKTYPYMYSLKKGTYYLKIYTKKKKCKYYLIDAYYSTDNYGPHFSENETGKTKKKAVRIKNSSDKGTVYGISFSFPLNSGSKRRPGGLNIIPMEKTR